MKYLGRKSEASDVSTQTDLPSFAPKRASGYINTTHNLSTSGWNVITGYTVEYDHGSIFSPSTGVVTIPVSGIYTVGGGLIFASNGTGRRILQIETVAGRSLARAEVTPAGFVGMVISRDVYLLSGETVRMNAFQTSGGVLTARGETSETFFYVNLK